MVQKIRLLLMTMVLLLLSSCHGDRTCESLIQIAIKPDLEKFVSIEEIKNGYNVHHANRNGHFQFCCVYLNDSFLDYCPTRINNDSIRIELKNIRVKSNDTLKLYYVDTTFLGKARQWGNNDIKFIKLIIEEIQTPCDSITNIFYKHITEKFAKTDSVYTNNKLELVELFDMVLQEKLQPYIDSLPKYERECEKSFFVLNYLKSQDQYGFDDNEYYLKPDLKVFLDSIAITINKIISERNWEKKQFIIGCTGYADERRYRGDGIIYKLKLENDLKVSIGKISKAYELTDLYKPQYKELEIIGNNNDLTIVRGFVSAIYLEKQLKKIAPDIVFEFKYKGGGVITGNNYAKNRKVDLSIGIKGGTQQKTKETSR